MKNSLKKMHEKFNIGDQQRIEREEEQEQNEIQNVFKLTLMVT